MRVLTRSILATAALTGGVALCSCAGTHSSDAEADRGVVICVPDAVTNAASVVACLFQRVEKGEENGERFWEVKSTATGTLVPNGDFVTAAHFLHHIPVQGESMVIGIDGLQATATVQRYEPPSIPNGDLLWVSIRFAEPTGFVSERLAQIRETGVRFDPDAPIQKGQRLFVAGFVHVSPSDVSAPRFGMEMRIAELRAKESSTGGPLVLIRKSKDVIKGMSGGPVFAFDEEASTVTVVGIASYARAWRLWRDPELIASRLPNALFTGDK